MEITNQIFRTLAAFANGETSDAVREEVVDLLDADPIYLEILLDLQFMVEQNGENWEAALEEDVRLMVADYEAKLQHHAIELVLDNDEMDALHAKTEEELENEMLEELERTYFSVGKKIAKIKGKKSNIKVPIPQFSTENAISGLLFKESTPPLRVTHLRQVDQQNCYYLSPQHLNNLTCHVTVNQIFVACNAEFVTPPQPNDTSEDFDDRTAAYLIAEGFDHNQPAQIIIGKEEKNRNLLHKNVDKHHRRNQNREFKRSFFVTACCHPIEQFLHEDHRQSATSRRAMGALHV